jgi:hypothetical protein
MIISVIAGLVTAFSVYQGCHVIDTTIQAKKAAKDTANDIVDKFDDIFEDDVIVGDPIIVDDVTVDNDDINNDDGGSDDGEQPPAQPRNEKGQFAKK